VSKPENILLTKRTHFVNPMQQQKTKALQTLVLF